MNVSAAVTATAHPDLLPLLDQGEEGVERHACIVLAMLSGAFWKTIDEWWYLWDGPGSRLAEVSPRGQWRFTDCLPNPLADTEAGRAAAWELETREIWGWEHDVSTPKRYKMRWVSPDGLSLRSGRWHVNRQRAAVLAVLHKYADGNLSHLIRPLLDKMTEEPV